ncbi:MAG: D-alanyl-D-alanine carboxypeptidase/D-alanyl-D-alanine-endopeptidase [Pseudomonadota bacterium]
MHWNLKTHRQGLDAAPGEPRDQTQGGWPRWCGPTALAALTLLSVCGSAAAQAPGSASSLPVEVEAALKRARVPREAMVAVVEEVDANVPVLSWQPQQSVNPASVMKLFPTYAALDLLGPAWTWSTPVWLQGQLVNPGPQGVLHGDLVIKGNGDPKLVMERVWLLLRRVQQLGVREIRGDIVLDRSGFRVPAQNPADFDGEPLKPYNVSADALLLNYKSVVLTFTPDVARNVALVSMDPPMAQLQADASVPLSTAPCGDWRAGLKADFNNPQLLRLTGSYPATCGERTWAVAYADPGSYNQRALLGMWQSLGGQLSGKVRDGTAPTTPPTFELASPSLTEVVRDINKYSNNVMAQQLFLTLGLTQRGTGTPEAAREVVRQWALDRLGDTERELVIDNGSGLSRESRVNAQLMAKLLQSAWSSPVMSELMSSLPVSGVDGTLKRSRVNQGRTHLKTGSLRDVVAVAGYVLHPNGRRYVLVAIVNHPEASAARPAVEALVQWASGPGVMRKPNALDAR